MPKTNLLIYRGQFRVDFAVALLIGCLVGIILFIAGTMEVKWTIFITVSMICLAALPVVPDKEKFFLYLFFFILPIDLDYHPIYIPPTVYRPLNGFGINLYELPLFFLLVSWTFRLATDRRERVDLFPWISIPFFLIFFLALLGVHRSSAPTVIKVSSSGS